MVISTPQGQINTANIAGVLSIIRKNLCCINKNLSIYSTIFALKWELASFFCKGQMVHIFIFAGVKHQDSAR